MSDAQSKNETAIERVTGDKALAERQGSLRIGVWSDESSAHKSGYLIAEALGDILARLWKNMEVTGPLSNEFLSAAASSAASGGQTILLEEKWNPPYDYVISIGTDLPPETNFGIKVGAAGWTATIGPNATVADDANPVGPAAASAIVAAEVFKFLFKDALGEQIEFLPPDFEWSAWDYGLNSDSPPIKPITFDDLHVFGVGAVTHGLLWLLERWPSEVLGTITLIDHDCYDDSNGQRYLGMRPSDLKQSKVTKAAERLGARHKTLIIRPYDVHMNKYFKEFRQDCLINMGVVGLDNPEHRRQLALKLPKRVINMWTEKNHLGAARFGFTDGWPCLYCAYHEDTNAALDETGQIARDTGLHPARVRELLYSAGNLTEEDASTINRRYNLQSPHSLIGIPLRSILGILCATGKITLPEASSDADVPFAFSSALAGIGGFIELLHELWGCQSEPGHWQLNVLKYPVPGNWQARLPIENCYLCGDGLVRAIISEKYK